MVSEYELIKKQAKLMTLRQRVKATATMLERNSIFLSDVLGMSLRHIEEFVVLLNKLAEKMHEAERELEREVKKLENR